MTPTSTHAHTEAVHARRTDPERLRDLIADRRMMIKEFQQAVGLSPSMVSAVLAGVRDFSDVTVRRVAGVLRCRVEDFTEPHLRPPRKARRPSDDAA